VDLVSSVACMPSEDTPCESERWGRTAILYLISLRQHNLISLRQHNLISLRQHVLEKEQGQDTRCGGTEADLQ